MLCVVKCHVGCHRSLLVFAWGLGLSALLMFTWNKVICEQGNWKPVRYWQALLVVATVLAFIVPKYYMKRSAHGKSHPWS